MSEYLKAGYRSGCVRVGVHVKIIDNIKAEIASSVMRLFDRIYMAKDRIKCQVFLNTLIYGLVEQLVASLKDC